VSGATGPLADGALSRTPGSAPRAILLDALGTLVALAPPAPALRSELGARFGMRISEAQARRAIAAEIAYYRANLDAGRDEQSLAELRRRCAEALRSALPQRALVMAPDSDALLEALLASLRFTVFADVVPALSAARARGQRLVVVSNWDVSLHAVMRTLSLSPLLDGIVTSAEVGARKPSPEIFDRALQLARAAPEQAVHIGDSIEEDVVGARNAGIEPILIRRDGGAPAPSLTTIATLAELA